MPTVLLLALILGAIVLWGLLLWMLIRTAFSVLSGWRTLASRYPAPQVPGVWHWNRETLRVGAVRYRKCMRLAAQPDGLYIAEAGLLRHPPLRIPWSEIHSPSASRFYGKPAVAITVGMPPLANIEFPAALYNAIFADHGRA